jgi:ubiquinone/menaquinone biosynthesis C-methylase UbiE
MLPRVLEPEVMDSEAEARDYDAMDHSHVNRVFALDFVAAWQMHPVRSHFTANADVLDVGTGTAQIPIELCRQAKSLRIVAVDLAKHMLDLAQRNIDRAGMCGRIRVQLCDAKKLPFDDETFPAVISNSIVHHIPDPRHVVGEMVRVLKPGGVIFVRDLLRPASDAGVQRLVDLYAGEANMHQRKMFDDSLRAALSLEEVRDLVVSHDFDPETVRQTSDRHWTWAAQRRPIHNVTESSGPARSA